MEQSTPGSDSPMVIEPDRSLPAVPRHPAPWLLRGSAYVFALRLPDALLGDGAFVPSSLVAKRRTRTGALMFVDYEDSPCGPYRELLVTPASFAFEQGTYPSITRIYVSTYDSVVNGRANWGIPKDRADFTREHDAARHVDVVRVSRDGHTFAELELRAHGPSLPVRTWLIPAGMRTLVQQWQGKQYRFTLKATGQASLASLVSARFDAAYFPDLAQASVIVGSYLPKFEMTFPEAVITNIG